MKDFITKNWVFISGLLSAIGVAIQQFIGQPEVDNKVILFAIVMAILSYLANQWRGKGVSFTGIVGMLAATFITVYSDGHIDWKQLIIQFVAAVLAAAAPPPKGQGYENAPQIKDAKERA